MFRVLIAGAGGFGREIASWIDGCHGANTDWKVAGFLNDDLDALNGYEVPERILATISGYQPQPDDRVIIAIGDPAVKVEVAERLRRNGAKFLQLIHRSAVVCRGVSLGEGVIVAPHVAIGGAARIGDFVALNFSVTVGHDAVIGTGCTLNVHSGVTGHCVLGQRVFLASHATVIPKIVIGDDAYLGAGTVVIRDVPPGSRLFGVPARNINSIGSPDSKPPN